MEFFALPRCWSALGRKCGLGSRELPQNIWDFPEKILAWDRLRLSVSWKSNLRISSARSGRLFAVRNDPSGWASNPAPFLPGRLRQILGAQGGAKVHLRDFD